MKTKNLTIAIAALLLFAGTSYGIPVQLVRIVQNKPSGQNPLQLAELTIIEAVTGTNLAPSGTASQSSHMAKMICPHSGLAKAVCQPPCVWTIQRKSLRPIGYAVKWECLADN